MNNCCQQEDWKEIPGFDSFYRISSCGRIQTCRATGGRREANQKGNWKDLKQFPTKLHKGHRCLQAYLYKNGVRVICSVHRLVYETFKGEIPEGYVIDHINRDSLDNHLSNLRIATQGENRINVKNKNSGVHFDIRRNKYRASIGYNKIRYELGYFEKLEDALEARKNAEIKLYKDFGNK